MNRREVLFAVIGGVVGAVLVMAAGSIPPLGAQDKGRNAEFGKITCRELEVIDYEGETKVTVFAGKTFLDQTATGVGVHGKNGFALMIVGEEGGAFGATRHSFGANNILDLGGFVQIGVDENGGKVEVGAINNINTLTEPPTGLRGVMGIDQYGNGKVSTWDKNGDRLAKLK